MPLTAAGLREVISTGENRVLTARLSPRAEATVQPLANALLVTFLYSRGNGVMFWLWPPHLGRGRGSVSLCPPLQPWVGTLVANYSEAQGIDSTTAAVTKTFQSGLE